MMPINSPFLTFRFISLSRLTITVPFITSFSSDFISKDKLSFSPSFSSFLSINNCSFSFSNLSFSSCLNSINSIPPSFVESLISLFIFMFLLAKTSSSELSSEDSSSSYSSTSINSSSFLIMPKSKLSISIIIFSLLVSIFSSSI